MEDIYSEIQAVQEHSGQGLERICERVYRFRDTCQVYLVTSGSQAVLVDFGSGDVLDHIWEAGVERITQILITHHHRDQCQGLARAVQAGIPIFVPETEQELFHGIEAHWQARTVFNNYNTRQDRFSLLEPVPAAGLLRDYESLHLNGLGFQVIPTPGHTTGSISLLVEVQDRILAFSGDLIYAPGKVWSMAATQWSYNGAEGAAASIASLLDLKERGPTLLLPSHGDPIGPPEPAIDLLVERLWELLQRRGENPRLFQLRQQPYEPITPHLLRHRASMANTYVLLSDSGKALLIDFGYDFITGIPGGSDRASRRPWLYTLPALKAQYGVSQVEVILPTHFHDDHVAGCSLLRRVEGAQVWAADSFAAILEDPSAYDLPCLWYEPIPVDRRLPLNEPFAWQEYSLRLHPLPGHTLYAVAIEFEVDGLRVLATGDQFQDESGLKWNYVYQNGFRVGDYTASAALYRRINPDLILPGHWSPLWVTPEYLQALEHSTTCLEDLHNGLLPELPDFRAGEALASIHPYQANAIPGEWVIFTIEVRSPFQNECELGLQVVAPPGWQVRFKQEPPCRIAPGETLTAAFQAAPPPGWDRPRTRLAVDLTIGSTRFGQAAEALVSPSPAQRRGDDLAY
jgi:glyoxylase-like metal-dependent hydrolase (beta-lactamase superfamily II)